MKSFITLRGLAFVAYMLSKIYERIDTMSAALDRLTAEVTESRDATNSVLALVSGLSDQIRNNLEDPAALEALANDLDGQQADIAAAVTANTPATPEPAPAPAEEPAPTE